MDKKTTTNKFINWAIYIFSYTIILYFTDFLFDSLYSESLLYDFFASIIIYILEKTIKPIIFKITIPITAITFGLFYPFINLFLLKIADFILLSKFDIYSVFWGFFIALIISIMSFILDNMIIKPMIRRGMKNE